MAGRSAILAVRILGDATDAQKAFRQTETGAGKWAGALKVGAVAAAGALVAVGKAAWDMAQSAADDEKAATLLAKSLKNTAGATDRQVAATERWITAQGKALGVADDDLRPALATLATATKDVGKAQKLASLAMDVAAARGIPLETASKAIAKAYAGQTTALGRLVPGLDQAALKSGDFARVSDALGKAVGGSATAAADTASGKWQRFQLQLSEAGESIGGILLPAFTALADFANGTLVPLIEGAVSWFQTLGDSIGSATGGLDVGNAVVKAAADVWAGLQPFIQAVGDYVTGSLIPAWQGIWSSLQQNVIPALQRLAAALAPVFAWIAQKLAPVLVGVFGAAFRTVGWIVSNVVLPALGGLIDGIGNVIGWLTRAASAVGGAFSSAWQTVAGIIDRVTSAIRSAVEWVQRAASAVGDFLSNPLGAIGDAIGGLMGRSAAGAGAPSLARSAGGRSASVGGLAPVVHVHGAIDPQQTARTIARTLRGADVRAGRARLA